MDGPIAEIIVPRDFKAREGDLLHQVMKKAVSSKLIATSSIVNCMCCRAIVARRRCWRMMLPNRARAVHQLAVCMCAVDFELAPLSRPAHAHLHTHAHAALIMCVQFVIHMVCSHERFQPVCSRLGCCALP